MVTRMMKYYYYLFYRLCKLWEGSEHFILSVQFRAEVSLIALELWFIYSLVGLYGLVAGVRLNEQIPFYLDIIIFIMVVFKILAVFTFSDKWKDYHKIFDALPNRQQLIGKITIWFFILSVGIGYFVVYHFYQKNVLGM